MNKKRFIPLAFCMLLCFENYSQKIASLEVDLSKPANGLSVPVKTNLDAITFLPDSLISLVAVKGSSRILVPYQVEHGSERTLHWIIDPAGSITGKQVYELVKGVPENYQAAVTTRAQEGAYIIKAGDQPLLQYNFKTVYPPSGIDTVFKRSGFIHPLWTPHGQVLTRIQAPDHYHHYGIWNPWTHVLFENDTIDFWNLKDHKGTVRFAKTVSTIDGPVYSEYEVLQENVVFKKRWK